VPEIEAVAAEVAALGRRTHFFPLDVSNRATLARAPGVVAEKLGPVDILVNNAGIHASAPLQRTDDSTWDAVLAVDLTAPFLLTRACLPGMYERRWGRILNVASVAARIGLKYGAAYSAAKHGLLGLTRSVAVEGAKKGVTANAICPSWTETQMLDDAVEAICAATGRTPAEAREAMFASSPLGRAALPEEVADVAVWLAGSPVVTGQAIDVDGGEFMA
jgi:NAD(P)-dependent dehydrogenase (short-subunit alcohol dehydrogenase family)